MARRSRAQTDNARLTLIVAPLPPNPFNEERSVGGPFSVLNPLCEGIDFFLNFVPRVHLPAKIGGMGLGVLDPVLHFFAELVEFVFCVRALHARAIIQPRARQPVPQECFDGDG